MVQLTKAVSEFKSKTFRSVGPKVSNQLAMTLSDPKKDQVVLIDTDDDFTAVK